MKIFLRHILVIGLIFLLTGCALGELGAMSARERIDYLKSIKPYIERWIKEGMSRESRIQDSISCGGNGDRGPGFSAQQLNAARQLEDKNDFAPEARLSMAWVECMKSKGYEYRYTGT